MEEIKNFIYSHSSPNGCVALTRSERDELIKMIEELVDKTADCSNCKHWHYSTRLLAYYCDCSKKYSESLDARTYEHCENWERVH